MLSEMKDKFVRTLALRIELLQNVVLLLQNKRGVVPADKYMADNKVLRWNFIQFMSNERKFTLDDLADIIRPKDNPYPNFEQLLDDIFAADKRAKDVLKSFEVEEDNDEEEDFTDLYEEIDATRNDENMNEDKLDEFGDDTDENLDLRHRRRRKHHTRWNKKRKSTSRRTKKIDEMSEDESENDTTNNTERATKKNTSRRRKKNDEMSEDESEKETTNNAQRTTKKKT